MDYYFYLIMFVVMFLICYIFFMRPKLQKIYVADKKKKKTTKKTTKKQKEIEVGELSYLVGKFNLDKEKLNWKSLALWISLIDSFIISFVVFLTDIIKVKYVIIELVIAFVVLFAMIYALYEIYGRILKSNQDKEN